jgi:hypothetical protein
MARGAAPPGEASLAGGEVGRREVKRGSKWGWDMRTERVREEGILFGLSRSADIFQWA